MLERTAVGAIGFYKISIKHMTLLVWLRKERVILQFNHLQDH